MAGDCARSDVVKTQATLTVHGPGQLRGAFRKRLIDALRADAPEVKWTDVPQAEHLSMTLHAPQGIPFPQLIDVSLQYPDCVASVTWQQDSAGGETTIQNGQVKETASGAVLAARRPQSIQLAPDGTLVLAFALDIGRDGLLGFCATADAETYFKFCGNTASAALLTIGDAGGSELAWDECWPADTAACQVLQPQILLDAGERRTLDALAAAFRAEWLWYAHAPLEDTVVERQRFAEAGRGVRAINVKSRQLATYPPPIVSSLAAEQQWIAQRLQDTWAQV